MKQRCCNPNASGYECYGGRGIKVCEHWLNSFENFLADMGEKPEGLSLDRIEGAGDYEPGNCRWATSLEQAANRRRRRRFRITDEMVERAGNVLWEMTHYPDPDDEIIRAILESCARLD